MEYLLYKFILSFIFAYILALIGVNVWNGIEYIVNRINHDDSEWVDNDTINDKIEEN